MTNAHVEIIEEQKKENKVIVMPVRFLNGEKEINSKSFPFSFETRKKINLNEDSNVLLFGCEGDADEELYQKLLNS